MIETGFANRHLLKATTALVAPAAMLGLFIGQAAAQETAPPTPSAPPPVEEIVVQGQFVPDEKRDTSEISAFLDIDDLARTGDANIALSLARVTGLSVVDGKFVYVRGLGERYSLTLLNGVSLPSPEPLRRLVPLDIFPTALLEGALVQKTYSPEFPLDFGGGVVSLRSRAAPEERFFEIGVSVSGDTATTFEDGLGYNGGDWDWLGFDDGFRDLPGPLSGQDPLDGLTPEQLEAAGESLPNVWSIDKEMNPVDVGVDLSYGDRFELDSGMVLGVLLIGNYDSDWEQKDGVRNTFVVSDAGLVPNTQLNTEVCRDVAGLNAEDCGLRSTEWTIGLNGLAQVGLEFDADNAVTLTSLLLRKSVREATIEQGFFAADPEDARQQVRFDWVEQQLWSNILSGEHYVSLFDDAMFEQTLVEWRASYATADREVPLRRQYFYEYDEGDQVFLFSARPDGNLTSFGDLEDTHFEAGLDIEQPINFDNWSVILMGGAGYIERDRESDFKRFGFDFPPGANIPVRRQVPEIIFGSVNVGPGGFELRDFSDESDFFTADEEIYQVYGAFEIQATPTLRIAGGIRYEDSEQFVNTINRTTDERVQSTLFGEYGLPAATVTWEFTPNMQLRGGYSMTINRPSLRELSGARFLEQDRDVLSEGNPFLTIAEVDNFDIRWEWYFDRDQFVTIGAFYKEISNPIERTVQAFGEGLIRRYVNAESAELRGVEFELEIDLPINEWFETPWLRRKAFYTKVNAAYIDSTIDLNPEQQGLQTDPSRPLQGQSDVVANFEIGYDDFEDRERAALLLNYTGERIDDVGVLGAPNFVEKPPVLLDFVYSREFTLYGQDVEFSFETRNLLNDEYLLEVGSETAESYDIGTSFSIGLKARF